MTECDEHKNSICRVCLNCDPPIHESGANIFEETDDVPIYEKLNTIADVNIRPEDGFPDRICTKCLQELHDAYSFKLKCETSNNILLLATNTNSDTKTDIKLEEDLYPEHEYLDSDMDANSPPEQSQEEEIPPNAERFYRGIDLKQKEDHYNDSEYIDEYNEAQTPTDFDKKEENTNRSSPAQSHTQPNTTNTERPSKAIDLKLECHDCGGLFKSKCKMKVHWKKEHLMQYLTCNKCKTVCKSFKAYNNHKQKDSELCNNIEIIFRIEGTGKLRKFFCKQCEYTTTKRAAVKHHVRKHKGEKRFQCDLCSIRFMQIGSLIAHKETKHQIYQREGPCDICGLYITGLQRFRSHMRKKHKKDNTKVSCDICHKVYKTKDYLIAHMNIHNGKSFSCDLCSKTFNYKANLLSHKKRVHENFARYEVCPICGYMIKDKSAMKVHIARHNDYNCVCTACGFFFENDLQLKLHTQRHINRNHKCSECDKTYYNRKGLLKHLQVVHKLLLPKKKVSAL